MLLLKVTSILGGKMTENSKFELFIGKEVQGKIESSKCVGSSVFQEHERHYTLRLMALPGITYYLVKNYDSKDKYTLFARRQKDESGVRFSSPVGMARLKPELSSYLELYIPVFKAKIYMSLFPKPSTQASA